MSIPGIPCIYYGDEIGMPGANDPDNRRMMYFSDWTEAEKQCFDNAQSWIKLRREHLPLIYGDTRILSADQNSMVMVRTYLDEAVIVAFNKSTENKDIEINLNERFANFNWKLGIGHELDQNGTKLVLTLHPQSAGAIIGNK